MSTSETRVWVQDAWHDGENDILPQNAIKDTEAVSLVNVLAGVDGEALKPRRGTRKAFDFLGSTPVNALYQFSRAISSPYGTEIKLAAAGDKVYRYDALGANSVLHTWTHAAETSFATLLNTLFITNGSDQMVAWDAKSDSVRGVTDRGKLAPVLKRIIAFRGRLWGFDAAGRRVYFSGTSDDSDLITDPNDKVDGQQYYYRWQNWSGTLDSDGGFDTIGDDDGQRVTGIGSLYNGIVVFKERSTYLWAYTDQYNPNDVNGATKDVLVQGVGCVHHDTIQYNNGALMFLGQNARGDCAVYRLTGGGIDDISAKIPNKLKRIVTRGGAAPRSIIYGSYYIIAADDFAGGGAARTLVYAYDYKRQAWFEIEGWNVGAFAYDPTRQSLLIGSADNGKILEYPYGSSDDGTPVHWTVVTRVLDGNAPMMDKRFRELFVDLATSSDTVTVSYSVDNGEWVPFTQQLTDSELDSWDDGSDWDLSEDDAYAAIPAELKSHFAVPQTSHAVGAFDNTHWSDSKAEQKVCVPLSARGRSIQVKVEGDATDEPVLRRIGLAFKTRKTRYQ